MSDFQVNKSQSTGEIRFATGRTSDFTRLKTKYRDFKAKTEKSDFANAPVVMQEELDMLIQLKALAKKEKLAAEAKWIEERENTVKEKLTTTKINLIANGYYAPVHMSGLSRPQRQKPDERLFELLNSCKNDYGILDPGAEKIFLSLQGKEEDLYHVKNILSKCREENGDVNPEKAEAVSQLATAGVPSSRMCEHLDTLTYFDSEKGKDCIDFDMLGEMKGFMSSGISDLDAVKFAQYTQGNFSDKDAVKSALLKLHKADISTSSIFKILNELAVVNPETGKKDISLDSVNSIATLKKSMLKTRDNETQERRNQINLLGVSVFKFGDQTMVSKDGRMTYMTPVEGENYEVTKEKYNQLVASIEDNMLLEFASNYKDAAGEIDNKYVRVASHLRNIGMVYNGLFDLMESCIKADGSINKEKIDTIKTIRSSGALSDDVPMLVDACRINDDGKYNQDDVQMICDLTSSVVGGKDVCSLLPVIRNNEDAKDIIMLCAPFFSDNQNLHELVSMMKRPDGTFGDTEMEVLYDLAFVRFGNDEGGEYGDDFVETAKEIMTLCRDKDGIVSDDAAGICAIIGKKDDGTGTLSEIKRGLKCCIGDDGTVDPKLAQILWDMCVQDASMLEVIEMIRVCKPVDGKLNTDKADMIIALFEAKYPKEKIAELVNPKH